MPSYDRRERVTRTIEFRIPTYGHGACWTEVQKAITAAHNELATAGEIKVGEDAADDRIRVTGDDEAIIVSYELRLDT